MYPTVHSLRRLAVVPAAFAAMSFMARESARDVVGAPNQPITFVIVADSSKYLPDDESPSVIADRLGKIAKLDPGVDTLYRTRLTADAQCRRLHATKHVPCDVVVFVQEPNPYDRSNLRLLLVFREPYEGGHALDPRPAPPQDLCKNKDDPDRWASCRSSAGAQDHFRRLFAEHIAAYHRPRGAQ